MQLNQEKAMCFVCSEHVCTEATIQLQLIAQSQMGACIARSKDDTFSYIICRLRMIMPLDCMRNECEMIVMLQ